MLFLYYAVERKVVSKGVRSREMAAAGNFGGSVTWFELGENDKNQKLYSMKVCPPLWRTGLRQNFRIFQNEDIESILGTILQENGVT